MISSFAHEVHTRSALNQRPGGTRLPFEWTVNPYRGCSHACAYCSLARRTSTSSSTRGEDFEREIVVKVNVPEVLRAELARPSWKGARVALGTNTDPYQWVEGRYKLMRGILEVLRDAANPCSILTKSPLVLRDLDLLLEIAERTEVSACLSVPTLDEKAWRATEPHTPHPRARLEAVAELNRAGIPTGVLIAPLMPGINDGPEQVEKIVELATEAGAKYIGGQHAVPARRRRATVFFDWLREHRPDLVARYEELYRRGAYLRGSGAIERRPARRGREAGYAERSARTGGDGAARGGTPGGWRSAAATAGGGPARDLRGTRPWRRASAASQPRRSARSECRAVSAWRAARRGHAVGDLRRRPSRRWTLAESAGHDAAERGARPQASGATSTSERSRSIAATTARATSSGRLGADDLRQLRAGLVEHAARRG